MGNRSQCDGGKPWKQLERPEQRIFIAYGPTTIFSMAHSVGTSRYNSQEKNKNLLDYYSSRVFPVSKGFPVVCSSPRAYIGLRSDQACSSEILAKFLWFPPLTPLPHLLPRNAIHPPLCQPVELHNSESQENFQLFPIPQQGINSYEVI